MEIDSFAEKKDDIFIRNKNDHVIVKQATIIIIVDKCEKFVSELFFKDLNHSHHYSILALNKARKWCKAVILSSSSKSGSDSNSNIEINDNGNVVAIRRNEKKNHHHHHFKKNDDHKR